MRISTKPFYKLFNVVHNYFLWMCHNHWEDISCSYLAQNVSKNLEQFSKKRKTWKCEYLLNHVYKRFSVVHNYFLWMFQIIERIYDDNRISPQCPRKLRKNCEKRKTWKCEYLLNHSINFSVWFTTTFYECFKSLRGYIMIVSRQNVPENLEKLRKKENLKMRISTKPLYKLFSVVHNYLLWMCLIIERIYHVRIRFKMSPKNLENLRKKENLEMRISTKPSL